jgi:hypothetical protein
MNTLDFGYLGRQLAVLAVGAAVYAGVTITACNIAEKRFDKIDL